MLFVIYTAFVQGWWDLIFIRKNTDGEAYPQAA